MAVCVLMRVKAVCPMLASDDQQSDDHVPDQVSFFISDHLHVPEHSVPPILWACLTPSTLSNPGVITLIAPAVMSKCMCCLYGQFYMVVQCRWCLMVSIFSDVHRVGF